MTDRIVETFPGRKARIAGGLWLITILAASFGLVAMAGMIVRDDPAATAANILAGESLYRLAFLAEFAAGLCYVGVTVLLYQLLTPVSRSLSLLAAFFGLGGVAIGGPLFLSRLAPLVILHAGEHLRAFTPIQLEEMALVSLQLHGTAFGICMVLFGLQCLLAGLLICRSSFLPSSVGGLLAIGGCCYVIISVAGVLSPAWGAALSPFIAPAGLVGEGSVTLWFLARGVNEARWIEQAGRLPEPAA